MRIEFKLLVLITLEFATVCLTTAVSRKYSAELKPLPEEGNYKASGSEYKKCGMEPLFDFARSFIRASLREELSSDFINYIRRGNFDMGGLWSQVQKNFIGYVVVIGIGVLLFIFFLPFGCCFCCCRLCGKCGANPNREFSKSANCHRRVLTSVVFIIATFALVGNICTYVSNDRMTTGLEEIKSSAVNNLDDINTFLDLTRDQVVVLGQTNLHNTRDAVINQMDVGNLSDALSNYITETLASSALTTMEPNIKKAQDVFAAVEKAIADFNSQCPLCNTFSSQFTTILNQKTVFNSFSATQINKQIADGIKVNVKSQLTGPGTNINGMKTEVLQLFTQIGDKISGMIDMINNFRHDPHEGFSVASLKMKVTEYSEIMLKYNKYRSIAGSVLSAIVTLIITLLILGIIFGCFGNTSADLPTNRGCVSHTGSKLLLASLVCIFIFSSLLMLLTTLSFVVGAPLERYVCQGLDGPNYALLKVMDDQSFLSGTGFNAKLSDIVRSCKEGKTAYAAFQLENSSLTAGFNMKDIQDKLQRNKKDINDKLNNTLKVISTMTGNSMTPTSQLVVLDHLKSSIASMNINYLKGNLLTMTAVPSMLQPAATNALIKALDDVENLGSQVDSWKTNMVTSITTAQAQLSAQKMGELVTNFTQDVFGIVDQYMNFASDGLENKLGKCTPLWNIYNSVLIVSFCKYTIDAFNGFWFSIGWCLFFFMPGIILAVKLEKYFRRMNSVGPGDSHSSDAVMKMKHNA